MEKLLKYWLATDPNDDKPSSDKDGDRVFCKNEEFPASLAAEISADCSDYFPADGDNVEVWVWEEGKLEEAELYMVKCKVEYSFSATKQK